MKKRILALLLAMTVAMLGLAGCSSSSSSEDTTTEEESAEATTAETETDAAAAVGEDAGFTEIEIFADEELGFLNVSAVYFQPVPMSNGNESIDGFDLHLEADVSALENDLGFGVGDWVPYMDVDYEVIASDGTTAAEGSFMVMSASDGPHYGANISLPDADTYTLVFTFGSPEDNGYLLHTDEETGPGGSFDEYWTGEDGCMTLTMESVWDYTPQEW